ncbi:hypothetical protein [Sediminibacillus terrae]|uniref:hypothetical protein n=1 Tax=Sediminibacillus terrae TaxID=1562106 RepID=UPI001297795B|nr:hypothetical protein [Sediminibacillus terrae]
MRFKSLLNMECKLLEKQSVGTDQYNRPIKDFVPVVEGLGCRADKMKRRVSRDEYGTDIIVETILFVDRDVEIQDEHKFKDIKEKKTGRVTYPGVYKVKDIAPVYKRSSLHHYEITLEKE